ncbi:uncharacterized protein F5891DRAFT_950847 [Suillus fuscotomentosus]|uniref:Tc1-like transposase DDE domain-containing protein n=1 Tax=Suillus fuscotomentosus TaxID=1912939 RepID=A0AAD4EA67_9AGAM|nr:uncharacterized protein F5891DRAFT_950847 [Suillus fuscotomentosus]KAG1901264.1 hypothetical protein F5891DRAFT_950847 [Suillus fuscotomentosus]
MVYQRISPDRKERALYLLLEEGWEIECIADVLGVSSRSIEQWEANYNENGCVNPHSPIMGRPCLLDQIMKDEICELRAENPSLPLDEISEWLAIYHDQPISIPALYHNLRDLGLAYKCLSRIVAECDDGFRADWLHNMTVNYTAEQLVFLDESSKDDRTVLPRYVIEGSVDSAEFYDFVVNDLPNMNPFPGPNSVIVLNNCSTHKSDALREAVEASGLLNATLLCLQV